MSGRQTQVLIDTLVDGLQPVPRRALQRWLLNAILLGAAAALLVLAVVYGLRKDLADALLTWPFWMKWLYALSISLGSAVLFECLARPGGAAGARMGLILAPVLILGAIALWYLLNIPVELRHGAVLGHSAPYCPLNIAALSLPVFLALRWALRRAAPTNLRWAGFATGLLAGAIGAFVYGLYCTESSVAFVAAWYTLGMLLPALLGAWAGPRLLRW